MPKQKKDTPFPREMPMEMQNTISEMVEEGYAPSEIREALRKDFESDAEAVAHIPCMQDLYNICADIRQLNGYAPPEPPKKIPFYEGKTSEEKFLLAQQMRLVEDVPLRIADRPIAKVRPSKTPKAGRHTLRSGRFAR